MRIRPGSKPRWQERPRTVGYEVHIPSIEAILLIVNLDQKEEITGLTVVSH